MWVMKPALLGSGEPEWIDLGTDAVSTVTGASTLNGAAYSPAYDALLVTTEAVAASDAYIGGFRYRADGALRVVDATSGVPAGSNTNQGIALSSDGQLCYTTTAGTAFNLNGVAVDGLRRVYAAPLAFALEFADLGAGVVDTTEAITGATATFTRATAATTVLSTGLIGAVASGDPRSYYDPTSLTYLGYLAEGARTNLCLESETLDVDGLGAPWLVSNLTVSANATTAPDGAATADKLVEAADVNQQHANVQTFTKAASAITYALSIFGKVAGRTWLNLQVDDGVNFSRAWFDLGNGATGSTTDSGFTTVSTQIVRFTNGYYRSTFVFTSSASATLNIRLCTATGDLNVTYDGDGASGLYLWGAQLEAAAFASSYIPTTTVAVARNADVLTYLTSGWLNASAGTMVAEATASVVAAGSLGAPEDIATMHDGTANERISIRRVNATGTGQFVVVDGSVTQCAISTAAISANADFKLAAAYQENNFAVVLNGGAAGTDASGTLPTVTTLNVGGLTSGATFYSSIRRVQYFAARLANATLQGLTA